MNNFELLNTLQTVAEVGMLGLFLSVVLSMNKALRLFNDTLKTKGKVEQSDVLLPKFTSTILANGNSILTLSMMLGAASLLINYMN